MTQETKTTSEGLMINFESISTIIPDDGQLSFVVRKSKDKLIVSLLTKYPVKHTDEKITPFTISGTPAEINEAFANGLGTIRAKEKTLVDMIKAHEDEIDRKTEETKKKNSTKSSSIKKPDPKPAKKTDQEAEKTVKKGEDTGAPDLFGQLATDEEASTAGSSEKNDDAAINIKRAAA